jgi:hypothetical protein
MKFRQFTIKPIVFFFLFLLAFSSGFHPFGHPLSLRPQQINDSPDLFFQIEEIDSHVDFDENSDKYNDISSNEQFISSRRYLQLKSINLTNLINFSQNSPRSPPGFSTIF